MTLMNRRRRRRPGAKQAAAAVRRKVIAKLAAIRQLLAMLMEITIAMEWGRVARRRSIRFEGIVMMMLCDK